MNDGSEGSHGAARGAQTKIDDDTDDTQASPTQASPTRASPAQASPAQASPAQASPRNGGFLRRIIGAISPGDIDEDSPGDNPAPAHISSRGMLNLRRLAVEDVMIPKAEIVSVPASITKDDLVQVFRDSGLTRIPVYQDTLDTPIGMAHLKDFALQYGFKGAKGRFALRKMLRPLLFVPPSMPIGILLSKMQAERRHLALVIDEYGGVDGLVTIEDLIEQVIGEIEDEHDHEDDTFFHRDDDGSYIALARTPLDEFEAEIGRSLTEAEDVDEEEIDTLGGLVFVLSGRVPVRGEVVKHPDGTEFEVIDADPRRIKRLRVRLPAATANAVAATDD